MRVDFFNSECNEAAAKKALEFGICDDQNGERAYTDLANPKNWISRIVNIQQKEVSFTAIDNCIQVYIDGTKDQESTCDGMLQFADSLYLVELKRQGTGGWITEAKAQLENTIRLLKSNHDLSRFRSKKAYACNKKHPNFTVIEASERKAFFERTGGFRLDVRAEIHLK